MFISVKNFFKFQKSNQSPAAVCIIDALLQASTKDVQQLHLIKA